MLRRTIPGFAFLLGLALAASAAASDQVPLDRFEKQLRKVAFQGDIFEGKPKPLCRCLTGVLTTAPAAGWITQEMTAADPTRVSLRCAIPSFDADGVLAAVNYCTNWSPL